MVGWLVCLLWFGGKEQEEVVDSLKKLQITNKTKQKNKQTGQCFGWALLHMCASLFSASAPEESTVSVPEVSLTPEPVVYVHRFWNPVSYAHSGTLSMNAFYSHNVKSWSLCRPVNLMELPSVFKRCTYMCEVEDFLTKAGLQILGESVSCEFRFTSILRFIFRYEKEKLF